MTISKEEKELDDLKPGEERRLSCGCVYQKLAGTYEFIIFPCKAHHK